MLCTIVSIPYTQKFEYDIILLEGILSLSYCKFYSDQARQLEDWLPHTSTVSVNCEHEDLIPPYKTAQDRGEAQMTRLGGDLSLKLAYKTFGRKCL